MRPMIVMEKYKMKFYLLGLLVCMSSAAFAKFLPDNEILVGGILNVGPSNTDEVTLNQQVAKLQEIYAPIVKSHGGRLSIRGDWKSERPNAAASQIFGSWSVVISGGLVRRPELTTDGAVLILCHELGHHLGGFAFTRSPIGTWAANEGQSDYFATHSCARKIWSVDLETNARSYQASSLEMRSQCAKVWKTADSQNLCARTLMAAESVAMTMMALKKETTVPDFRNPDQSVVKQTAAGHPATQCRMDTSLQGALCAAEFGENLIPGKKVPGGPFSRAAELESAKFTCTKTSNYNIGLRPACWFKSQVE